MQWDDFNKWFNKSFWRAFKSNRFPIHVPKTPEDKAKTVRKVFDSIVSARYSASIPEAEIIMNKGCGVARTVPVFCIEDYIVYYFCIKELEDVLCVNRTKNTFGGWSLGGEMRRLEEDEIEIDAGFSRSRYSFDPHAWTRAFGQFNALLFSQIDAGNYKNVLQLDLSNFYDCVRLDILERWIREEASSSKGWVIALLFYFLNQWNRKNTGLHPQAVGLPQDALADCSRILANFYLQRYDKYAATVCAAAGCTYFRYADDQMILLRSTVYTERLMLLLTRYLDRFGLRVNQKKVEVTTTRKLQNYRCRRIQEIFSEKGDSKKPELVRRFADEYLAIPENKLKSLWNGGFPLLNRLLWSNLESLPKVVLNKLVIRFTSKTYLLLADAGKLKRVHGLNAIRPRPIDLSRRIRLIGEACDHNSFHFQALSFAREIRDKDLVKNLEGRIAEINGLIGTELDLN